MNILERLKELGYYEIYAITPLQRDVTDLIEEDFGFRIPKDYAEFLSAYPSSGAFDDMVGFTGDEACSGSDNAEYLIISLFGISPESKGSIWDYNPSEALSHLNDPELSYFVIGDDYFSNPYCMKTSGDDFGAIFFYERNSPGPPVRLCGSFSDMVSRMYIEPDE